MVIPLISQIASLFLMMGLGLLIVKLGLLRSEDSRILSLLCIYVVTPCVNIHAFQITYTPNILQGFLLAVALSLAMHLLLFLLSAILKRTLGMTEAEQLSVVYPNSGNLVIPLVTALMGAQWVIYASAFMSVQLLFIWTHGVSVMSGQKRVELRKILTNVNLLCVIAGLLLFLFRVELPAVVDSTLGSVAGMLGPLSMIMIGMMIAGMRLDRIVTNRRIYLVSAVRLILAPILAIVAMKLAEGFIAIPDTRTIMTIVLLAVVMPASSTVTQLAQLHQREAEYSGSINVMTTLLSIATMPLIMALWERFV